MILINVLIVGLLLIILRLYFEGRDSEIVTEKSEIDGQEYLVRNLPDKVKAANNIAIIRRKFNSLVSFLEKNYAKDERIIRLKENFRDDVLSEAPADSEHTSYSINKGEKIYFCLRQRDERNRLVDLNTVTFVALHELSHVLTESIGHTKEFWNNFRFVLENAIKMGVYKYQPFHLKPVKYCGTLISDTPLK